jgi:hypothetical protein
MSDFVGTLTIYTWVKIPDVKSKRITIHRFHFCESVVMGAEILRQWKDTNPELDLHAEFIVTRYID